MIDGLIVRAYIADKNAFIDGWIRKSKGKYFFEPSSKKLQPEVYASPGFIDMHTHFFDGFGLFGTNADEIGYKTGTCMLAESGTVGEYTIDGFRKYIAPTIRTNFTLFLCISPIGVIYHHEYNAMEYLSVEKTVKCVRENHDLISGIKVRIGSEVIRHEGIEPLKIAAEAARELSLPKQVHIGGNPPYITEIEPYMYRGDIITHCFNARGGDMWESDGTPAPATQAMLRRGVIFDVGHGGGSFSFDVAEKAIKNGSLPKMTIGSDLHKQSRKKYCIDLPTLLTKMYGIGLPLEDILYGITKLPAKILRLNGWCDMDRELKNITFFKVIDQSDTYIDCENSSRIFHKAIKPIGVILKGKYIAV
ncbi:MAG: hypothetical protein GX974_02825 [Clostridiales bacterium]|nr:hypothetical protein [Clostridiales bacterium]